MSLQGRTTQQSHGLALSWRFCDCFASLAMTYKKVGCFRSKLCGTGLSDLYVHRRGMPTLVRGLRQFESIFLGWKLAQGGLVYTR